MRRHPSLRGTGAATQGRKGVKLGIVASSNLSALWPRRSSGRMYNLDLIEERLSDNRMPRFGRGRFGLCHACIIRERSCGYCPPGTILPFHLLGLSPGWKRVEDILRPRIRNLGDIVRNSRGNTVACSTNQATLLQITTNSPLAHRTGVPRSCLPPALPKSVPFCVICGQSLSLIASTEPIGSTMDQPSARAYNASPRTAASSRAVPFG